MSQALALNEIKRFLSKPDPEVLSISGRWGVGKTHAWDTVLKSMRTDTALRHYAYVSVFGVRSLDDLKTAIVQSTVSLDGNELEPSVDSFVEHLSSILSKNASNLPYVGKLGGLLAPGASLLIRNQIICIDDIERAGQGLDVADILGLISSFRERKGCKVVMLLSEDDLGDQAQKFREYLEKVVDQAIRFEPTPQESAAAALNVDDNLSGILKERIITLGITNIRVIRRIRRFLSYIEPQLAGLHDKVVDTVVRSITLLGWCVFEPQLAPNIDRVRSYNQFSGLFGEDRRSIEEKKTDLVIRDYGFDQFGDLDSLILKGLKAGAFDTPALQDLLQALDATMRNEDVRAAIGRPWMIFYDSLNDNVDEFTISLVQVIEQHPKDISPGDVSKALEFLRELGQAEKADELVKVYIDAQADKPREFFAARHDQFSAPIDAQISRAFDNRLKEMPLTHDPAEILIKIGNTKSWDPAQIDFLASVPDAGYSAMLKRLKGADLHSAISTALMFDNFVDVGESEREVARRMRQAVQLAADESTLNRMRLQPYLRPAPAAPIEGKAT